MQFFLELFQKNDKLNRKEELIKMRRIIIAADFHLEIGEEVHSSYKLVKKFVKYERPDLLILAGDAFDFSYLGSYNILLEELRENKRLKLDFDFFNKEIDYFQKYCKEVVYLEGNHEFRLTRQIQKYPNFLRGLIDIETNLHLEDRKILWLPEVEQPYKVGKLYVIHGKRYNIHFCKATLEDYGSNICMAHAHRIQTYTKKLWATGEEIGAWGIGTLSSKNPDWQNGKPNCWQNGFAYLYVQDNGNFTLLNIHIIDNSFIFNGKLWRI